MITVPTNTSYKLVDNGHIAGTSCMVLTFKFEKPVSKIYLQGAQIKRYDDIPATAQYDVFEGIGADEYNGINGSIWTHVNSTTYNMAQLATITTPGFDGCAVYQVRFTVSPTARATFDFCVLGIE